MMAIATASTTVITAMMRMGPIDMVVAVLGAGIVVGWSMVEGLRVQRWVERTVPGVLLPAGVLPVVGCLVGVAIVASWLR